MTTNSLRKDHDLIEKVLKSMQATIQLLTDGKKIPESILMPVVEFSKNFTIVCHHGKEEESLFPALERTGMPTRMGPIAVMLMEHEVTKKIANKIDLSSQQYLKTGDAAALLSDMQQYVEHVTQHLWKENNRLFMMADMRLQSHSDEIESDLEKKEESKLEEIGNKREHYEKLAEDLSQNTS